MINHDVSGKEAEDFIHNVLTKNRFNVKREVKIHNANFEQKHKERKIDIKFTYGKMDRYLEVDGKVHGNLETPTESTIRRNADFERTNLPYIIINTESISKLRKIMGLKNVSFNELTEFIVTYRAWEEYSKHLAKLESGEFFV
jgi:hypothetical protein